MSPYKAGDRSGCGGLQLEGLVIHTSAFIISRMRATGAGSNAVPTLLPIPDREISDTELSGQLRVFPVNQLHPEGPGSKGSVPGGYANACCTLIQHWTPKGYLNGIIKQCWPEEICFLSIKAMSSVHLKLVGYYIQPETGKVKFVHQKEHRHS